MNRNIAIISSFLLLPFSVLALDIPKNSLAQTSVTQATCNLKPENGENGEYSPKQLQTLASQITVKVLGDNNGGSGTIIAQQGNTYLVLTNSHVIRGVTNINLTTSDGKKYPAEIVPNIKFDKSDLALLQFQTNQNYCLLQVANTVPDIETEVIAAGYFSPKGEIVFRPGTVQQISQKPLKEGYQIGYSSDIEQGMSGGAIINSVGQIIGINGRSAYPILNTGYVYPDGSRPSEEEIQQMRKLSWGIPISTFLAQIKPDIITAYSLPFPDIKTEVPSQLLPEWLKPIEQKAKQITVRIDSSSNANGSGVIIAKQGDLYTVLTAAHVLCERKDATEQCGGFNYQIIAPDGKQYPVEKSSIKSEEGVDLAVVKFRSQANYQVATLANYNPRDRDFIFTAGYPKLGEESPWRFTLGYIFEKATGIIQVIKPDVQNNSSANLQGGNLLTGGYELVYTSITYGGMSGGPVLDTQGRVIGIHGRAEGETAFDKKTGDAGTNRGNQVQLGNSLGIPVSTFLALADRLNTKAQKVETTSTLELNKQKIESIEAAILSVDISKGNTTASQWIERGNQLWRLRRNEEAIKAFDEAIKLKPAFIHLAYYGKGLVLSWADKPTEAVAALQQALKDKPDFAAAWLLQSYQYFLLKDLDKALVSADKGIQVEPKNSLLHGMKGMILMTSGKYTEAEVAMTKSIDLTPGLAIGYFMRASSRVGQKKWDLALDDCNRAIKINPQFAIAYALRGIFYYGQEKWDLALNDFDTAIAIGFDYSVSNIYSYRGGIYFVKQKWDLALKDLNKAIDIDKYDTNAYLMRGLLYYGQNKWDLSLKDFNNAITLDEDSVDAYKYRGLIYYNQKKWDLSLKDFNEAIDINGNDPETYKNRGNVYYSQKRLDLALKDYNKAIAINPNYDLAYNNRGNVYKDYKKWDLSLADYNKAIAINKNFVLAYNNRGNLYYKQKKWDLALKDFNKAIDINKKSALAYNNIGLLKYEQGEIEAAIKQWQQAIKIDNKFAEPTLALAIALYGKGEKNQANELAVGALILDKDFADVNFLKNLWGDKMISDAQKFLSTTEMKTFLSQLKDLNFFLEKLNESSQDKKTQ